jgi:hypothetical protein
MVVHGMYASNRFFLFLFSLTALGLLLFPAGTSAQTWTWRFETVAPSGKQASLAIDPQGNLHLSYLDDQEQKVKYAFRPVGSTRWFMMDLGGTGGNTETFTKLTLDQESNPHICFTPMVLKYDYFDGKQWHDQPIAQNLGDIQYSCAVAIAMDGTPNVIWYHYANPDHSNYLHIKYAVLKEGEWLARTIDFAAQTGKFESLALDPQGNPYVSYDAFVNGELRYARLRDGKWSTSVVDSRGMNKSGDYDLGMGNSVALTKDGMPMIVYYTDHTVAFAQFKGDRWSVETVDTVNPTGSWLGYRSCLVLDAQGLPHLSYEDGGVLKHAFWDGTQWHIQVVVRPGPGKHLYHSMTIGPNGMIYIAFRDPTDSSLKLATGRLSQVAAPTTAQKDANP